jgi:hypothetical protein
MAFGVVLTRSEVLSWFRIREMFRFQSLLMYGIIRSAIARAAISLAVIKRAGLKSVSGDKISLTVKPHGSGTRYGARGDDLRPWVGADRRLPRAAIRADRQWGFRDFGCGHKCKGRHMDLRMVEAAATLLS